ncbi:MAG: mechanosensitive ion channel protein [Gammaproteobacteria bacterium]|nr:mechanosensitive ion channel [bacterium AH-315-E07]PCH61111.1 MAG: mechanosensitive ion channel protein [Gammaproteobacteria bacterium]
MEWLREKFDLVLAKLIEWGASPEFYTQIGLVVLAIIAASILARFARKATPFFQAEPEEGVFFILRQSLFKLQELLFPLVIIVLLGAAVQLSSSFVEQSWLIRIAQGLVVIGFLYTIAARYISNSLLRSLIKWLVLPLSVLHVFGLLDDFVAYIDGVAIEVGNIRLSVYGIARVVIFGGILFWFGRISNSAGQKAIRSQQSLDAGTREVFAKLFQIVLFATIFVLLLQVMGINLTALAIFGGALGVGLGFGLQQIASNFISGLIILLDRSVTIGDYIELENGKSGTISELNMRATTLLTFEGKEIVVPNEQFITSSFTNWTHTDRNQRYAFTFSVAYKTDIDNMLTIIRKTIRSHPQVLDSPELADVEINEFGESGIDILVEFWMEGIDDGINHVEADLKLMIWHALKENNIEIPFPQREVKIVGPMSS